MLPVEVDQIISSGHTCLFMKFNMMHRCGDKSLTFGEICLVNSI